MHKNPYHEQEMSGAFIRRVLPDLGVFALGIVILVISLTTRHSAAYLFPKILSVAMIIFAILGVFNAVNTRVSGGKGLTLLNIKTVFPGLIVMILLLVLPQWLGLYVSSTLAIFTILCLYGREKWSLKVVIKRATITLGFMVVLYLTFAILLKVQTPKGVFF